MGGWSTFWTWTLGISVALFFLVEVVVVIGGASDIKAMFATLREQAEEKEARG
jgi:hypothetical protein